MAETDNFVKSSIGWLELVNYSANPTDTDANRRGLAFVSGSLKYWNGSSWVSVSSAGGVSTWDDLYDLDKTLSIDDGTFTIQLLAGESSVALTLAAQATATGALLAFSNSGTGNDVTGTSSTWSVTSAGAGTFASLIAESLTAAANLTIDATGTGTIIIGGTSTGAVTIGPALTATASITITGTADTDCLTVTAGDVVISNGKITLTNDDTDAALTVVAAAVTTGNVILITANGVTSGNMINLVTTASGFSGGTFLTCNDGSVRFSVGVDGATLIASGVNSTKALEITGIQTSENVITVTSSGVTADNKAILLINSSGNSAAGSNQIRIAPSGTPVETSVGIEFVGASKLMQAMVLDGDSVDNSVAVINGGGALASTKAVLEVTADGEIAAGGTVARFGFSGTDTNTPSVVYSTTSGAGAVFEGVCTNAGALGAWIKLYHNSASPANSDVAGRIAVYAKDASANVEVMSRIDTVITDVTAGSTDADLLFYVMKANTVTLILTLDSDVNGLVVGSGAAAAIVTSNGAYDLTLSTNSGTTSSLITITDGADGAISLIPNGAGIILVGSGAAAGTISSSGAYDLKLETNSGTNSSYINIVDGAAGAIKLVCNTTGVVEINNTDAGALGAVLQLNHVSASAAANDVVGRILFTGIDDAAAAESYARIDVIAKDIAAANPDGIMAFYVDVAGTLTEKMRLDADLAGIQVGTGAAAAIVQSSGNYDLILKTGNGTTGDITITDGANGNITLSPNGSGQIDLANVVLMSKTQSLTGAGAVDVVSSITEITTTAADALTLADGTEGQLKFCIMLSDGGEGTLTPANPGGFATIKFNDVGDSCLLMFTNSKWYVISNNGCTVA
ncbi:hypothetical protein M0R01_04440 [bacterium]|jgi:hypothetical protein|nr:hypothetical protein [bacterium]